MHREASRMRGRGSSRVMGAGSRVQSRVGVYVGIAERMRYDTLLRTLRLRRERLGAPLQQRISFFDQTKRKEEERKSKRESVSRNEPLNKTETKRNKRSRERSLLPEAKTKTRASAKERNTHDQSRNPLHQRLRQLIPLRLARLQVVRSRLVPLGRAFCGELGGFGGSEGACAFREDGLDSSLPRRLRLLLRLLAVARRELGSFRKRRGRFLFGGLAFVPGGFLSFEAGLRSRLVGFSARTLRCGFLFAADDGSVGDGLGQGLPGLLNRIIALLRRELREVRDLGVVCGFGLGKRGGFVGGGFGFGSGGFGFGLLRRGLRLCHRRLLRLDLRLDSDSVLILLHRDRSLVGGAFDLTGGFDGGCFGISSGLLGQHRLPIRLTLSLGSSLGSGGLAGCDVESGVGSGGGGHGDE
ncbi:hypothetical protein B0H12DRAFT_1111282 [Mycena haematopus]|nr:hypothetical protein B0H12DRAFT_1111282 [Mycena haematopus]